MNPPRVVLSSLKAQIKRRFYYYFSPNKVKEDLKKRRGECLSCGKCCQAVAPCPMLFKIGEKLLCKIHQHKPYACHLYPVNNKDFFKHLKTSCGYWFVNEDDEKEK